MSLFHQQMAQVGELCLGARRLLVQPRLRVGGRLMRVVLPLFATEIDRGIPRVIRRLAGRVPTPETLLARPRLQQRAVDGEMPAEQQVVLQLLHQQPLAPNRIESLQQECTQQLFRRNRRPPDRRIESIEPRRQTIENHLGQASDGADDPPARVLRATRN
jgi:hypothetical protein